jgi:hypothetical protein
MSSLPPSGRASRAARRCLSPALACVACMSALALAPAALARTASPSSVLATSQSDESGGAVGKPAVSATVEQCATALVQSERSATFAGEMTTIAGAARMEMRVDLLERAPGEMLYRTVSAPGLGVWRVSADGVRTFKSIQQVTNLSAPAFYRGAVRFRWLSAKGRVIKQQELRTPRCEQPIVPSTGTPPAPSGSSSAD